MCDDGSSKKRGKLDTGFNSVNKDWLTDFCILC